MLVVPRYYRDLREVNLGNEFSLPVQRQVYIVSYFIAIHVFEGLERDKKVRGTKRRRDQDVGQFVEYEVRLVQLGYLYLIDVKDTLRSIERSESNLRV